MVECKSKWCHLSVWLCKDSGWNKGSEARVTVFQEKSLISALSHRIKLDIAEGSVSGIAAYNWLLLMALRAICCLVFEEFDYFLIGYLELFP